MRKLSLFILVAAGAIVMTSCSKLGALSSDNFVVTPTPLEAQGGQVPTVISITFPEKYMKKKAEVTVIPVLTYEGGEAVAAGSTFRGEKVETNATLVRYKEGDVHNMRASFPYTEAMMRSDLVMRFDARIGKKSVKIPEVKVGYGVVATSDLLAKTLATANPALAPDAYQRIIEQRQEAQIMYLVNQANIRASELKTTSISDFATILREINDNQETLQLQNIEVSAYASPEGSFDFNERLAERRQNSSAGFVNEQLRRNRMKADVVTRFTAEDWDGFQLLVSQSDIQDKEVILRVLSMYQDPAEREQQIRNMSIVYDELAKGILPELRRARLIATYNVIGRTLEQIEEQYAADPRQLSIEEILYGAANQQDAVKSKAWYVTATELFPQDVRAYNNLANIAYRNGDAQAVATYMAQAKSIDSDNSAVATNEALMALVQGNVAAAEAALARGAGADTYNEMLGNLNLAKGNFAAAASNLAGVNTNTALLAQILNKDYASAATTLSRIQNADAYTSYLSAILAARQGNASGVVSGLQSAIQQEPALAQRAARDLEFEQFAEQIAGLIR